MEWYFADKDNLSIVCTGQTMEFYVRNRMALVVDLTSVDLIDLINDTYNTYIRTTR